MALDLKEPDSQEKSDHQYDPYSDTARDLYKQEREADPFDSIASNYDKTADATQENENIAKTRQAESSWETNVKPRDDPKTSPSDGGKRGGGGGRFKSLKRRSAFFGIGGGLIGIVATILGITPFSLPINIAENLTISNDSSATSMQRRFLKVFGNSTDEQKDPNCSKKSMKCKMGKISNNALRDLSKKGVVPVIDGKDYSPKRGGYPDKNPTAYKISANDGKVTTVPANQMREFLTDPKNREAASRVLGTGGAFNFRVKAWAGKHIATKFYSKFGIKRDGGIANGEHKTKTVAERIAEARTRLLAEPKNVDAAADKATAKATRDVKRAKKGGVGYTIAVGSCVAIKAPGIIAAAAAAIQLAQIMPIVMDLVLSPASKAKGSGVDIANSITANDADAVGSMLTEQTKNADGKMTSALDSQYLLAAMGVNKGKPKVSKKFAPGYGLLTNPVVVAANEANRKLEPACNAIMSPAAMYTAMAIDAAVTVAASATIIGGIIKVAASWAISELAVKAAEAVVGDQAKKLLLDLAQNDSIPKAKGQELGDIIGISAAAFFSSGGMARHLPALTKSQVVGYEKIKQENETFNKEMEIASHSPLDVSSQYTFLGSIVRNINTAMIANGGYGSNIASNFANVLKLPAIALATPNAGAAMNYTENYCGHAEEFKLNTENKADTPAINMAGLPCTGMTASQDAMAPETAIDLLTDEGWLCNPETESCPEIAENATIEELMPNTSGDCEDSLPETCHQGSGYIKKDTLLYEYIQACSNPETGDYLYNSASCTVPSSVENAAKANYNCNSATFDPREEGGDAVTGDSCAQAKPEEFDEDLPALKDTRSILAMTVFLVDFQVHQSMNGEDEGEVTKNVSDDLTVGTPDDVKKLGRGWTLEDGKDYTSVPCAAGTTLSQTYTHPIIKSKYNLCKINGTGIIANSLVSANIRSMVDDAKADGTTLNGGSFRDIESQIETRKRNCTGDPYTTDNCNPPTAKPGRSQHERGLAIDFGNPDCNTHSTACYKWLKNNAKRYGFYNLASEPWHWSTSGN
jgi:LAS superfamily LD-carboxypeptidase LdcB